MPNSVVGKKIRLKQDSGTTFESKSCYYLVLSFAVLLVSSNSIRALSYIFLGGLMCSMVGYFWHKIVRYWSQVCHEINRKITSREITSWEITCRNIASCKTSSHELVRRSIDLASTSFNVKVCSSKSSSWSPGWTRFANLTLLLPSSASFLVVLYLVWVPFSCALTFDKA